MSAPLIDLSRNAKQAAYFNEVMYAVAGQSPSRFFAYGGGIRGGKTYVTLFILLLLAKKYPGSRWHIIRKDFPLLQATTIPSLEKLAPVGAKWSRNRSNYYLEMPNGSRIFFKGENIKDDPSLNDFLGLETNGIFIEQAEEVSEKMLDRAIERTGSWYIDPMPPGFIFTTFNPTDGWPKVKFYDPYKDGTLAPPYFFQEALPSDNPFVTDDQRAGWKQMDEISYRRMVEGDWDARRTGNEFYHAFSRSRHVVPVDFDPELPVHLSFDQNVSPYITMTCWQLAYEGSESVLRQFDELCLSHPDNSTEVLCQRFLQKYPTATHAFFYGDASGHNRSTRGSETDYDIVRRVLRPLLNNHSDRTQRRNPDVLLRRAFINNVLSEKYSARLFVGENCKHSIADLHNVKLDGNGHKLKSRVKDEDGVSSEKYGHTSDTLDYIVTTIFEREYLRFISPR
jgi:hypothetical protein